MLSLNQLINIETAIVRTLQGGRLEGEPAGESGPARLTEIMEDDTHPYPNIVTGNYYGDEYHFLAFTKEHMWLNNSFPSYNMYDFVETQKVINFLQLECRYDGLSRYPKDWVFQGTNDGTASVGDAQYDSKWDTLLTVSGSTISSLGWGDIYQFDNETAYRAYRLYITDNDGDTYVEVSDSRFGRQGKVLKWVPHTHGTVGLFNGSTWVPVTTASAYVPFYLTELDINGSSLVEDTNYDVYATYISYDDFKLDLVPWLNDNNQGQGPELKDGVLVYDNSTTSGSMMRYLGSVRITDRGFTDWEEERFIVNHDNVIYKNVITYNQYGDWYDPQTSKWSELHPDYQTRGQFLCVRPDLVGYGGVNLRSDHNTDVGETWLSLGINTCAYSAGLSCLNETTGNYRPSLAISAYSYLAFGLNYITILIGSPESNQHFLSKQYGGGSLLIPT